MKEGIEMSKAKVEKNTCYRCEKPIKYTGEKFRDAFCEPCYKLYVRYKRIRKLGGTCSCCGISDWEYLNAVKRNGKYVVFCANCQHATQRGKICPHQVKKTK